MPEAASEPEVVSEEPVPAVQPEVVAERGSRYWRMNAAIGVLTVIALVAALYLARAFFVPLLVGILASYALSPVVDWLKTMRVPRHWCWPRWSGARPGSHSR